MIMKSERQIAIITFEDDIHGLRIAKRLEEENIKCFIIESNKICNYGMLNWCTFNDHNFENTIKDNKKFPSK